MGLALVPQQEGGRVPGPHAQVWEGWPLSGNLLSATSVTLPHFPIWQAAGFSG